MKLVLKNSNLVFANLNGELIYDGVFTKNPQGNIEFYIDLESSVAAGEKYAVIVKANMSVMDTQRLDLYFRSGSTVVSNIVSLSNKTLLTDEIQYLTIIASGDNAQLRIYSERGYNDVVFSAKVFKL